MAASRPSWMEPAPAVQPPLSAEDYATVIELATPAALEPDRLSYFPPATPVARWWAVLLERIALTLLLWAVLYFTLVGYPWYYGFLPLVWDQTVNMFGSGAALTARDVGFSLLLCFFVLFEFAFALFLYAATPRDFTQVKPSASRKIALLIPVHRPTTDFAATLHAALKVFPPYRVLVVENNKLGLPTAACAALCAELGTQYLCTRYANKAANIYLGLCVLVRYPEVMQIDDDVHLAEETSFPELGEASAAAYLIKGGDHSGVKRSGFTRWLQDCQQMEFQGAGILKACMAWVGSVDFAHGRWLRALHAVRCIDGAVPDRQVAMPKRAFDEIEAPLPTGPWEIVGQYCYEEPVVVPWLDPWYRGWKIHHQGTQDPILERYDKYGEWDSSYCDRKCRPGCRYQYRWFDTHWRSDNVCVYGRQQSRNFLPQIETGLIFQLRHYHTRHCCVTVNCENRGHGDYVWKLSWLLTDGYPVCQAP